MNLLKTLSKEWKSGIDIGLLLLRVIFGLILIIGHGWFKTKMVFSGDEISFLDPIGIGMKTSFFLAWLAESLFALFIILGFMTRISSIILAINFLVIVYLKMGVNSLPVTEIEHIVFYFVFFISLIFSGAGKFSLDNLLFKDKR